MNLVERTVTGVAGWVNDRAPSLLPAYKKHMSEYYAPKNFNLFYYFGA
jgi:ubiquinol-cytochrome c reductase cytochrome b subunit